MVKKYSEFIKESVDDYVDFSKIDMKYDFNTLNKELFNNELEMVPLEWMKSKRKLGEMRSLKFRGDTKEFNMSIFISTFYKLTRQQYLDILAHEMIHLYLAQTEVRDSGHHGHRFKKMMNDINKKHDAFNIKPSENAAYYSLSDNTSIPKRGVVLLHIDDEQYDGFVTHEKLVDDRVELDKFVEEFRRVLSTNTSYIRNKKVVLSVYKVEIPAIATFKAIRKLSFRNLSIFSMDDKALVAQIKANKKILETRIK